MAEPVYKHWLLEKWTDAWYQLSQEEQRRLLDRIASTLEQVGGKSLMLCQATWAGDQYVAFGLEEYPSIEAVQKHEELIAEIGWPRYRQARSVLGTKWPGT